MTSEQVDLSRDVLFSSIEQSLAIIVFDSQGTVLWANENFADTLGYKVEELNNIHHRQFCLDEFTTSTAYVAFWNDLRRNNIYRDKVQRVKKNGDILWLDAMYSPVTDERGNVINVVKVAIDVTNSETILKNSSDEFMALVEQMTASTNEVHHFSQQTVSDMENLENMSSQMKGKVEEIGGMATSVKDIAAQSKILGLNASIEASRAGEQGRGFSVVANEIQKLAAKSKTSAENITTQLDQMEDFMKVMVNTVKHSTDNIHHNSESINELKDAYEHMAKIAEELSTLIKQ